MQETGRYHPRSDNPSLQDRYEEQSNGSKIENMKKTTAIGKSYVMSDADLNHKSIYVPDLRSLSTNLIEISTV
jgi:hypothetical protein